MRREVRGGKRGPVECARRAVGWEEEEGGEGRGREGEKEWWGQLGLRVMVD